MKRVVMYSGGIGSWAAAKRVTEKYGTDDLTLLFADTRTEDEDTYRFLRESAANVGSELVEIADGRTIWEVFRDTRFLGNTRADPCSRILKRELCDSWLAEHRNPGDTIVYVGIDWSESHRYERLRDRRLPWRYEAPMLDRPYLTKRDMHEWASREGLKKQRLYEMASTHANCGGLCVKMGIGGFSRMLRAFPERYAEWETNEATLREQLGDVSILRDRTGGEKRPLTLRALRERLEAGYQPDLFSVGGCGCFSGSEEVTND